MSIVMVEGPKSVFLGTQAWVVEEGREMAWAQTHITRNPALKYILGRYVEADSANENGHIFDLAELPAAQKTIPNSPLNMLHHPHYIVGNFMASELVYPTEATAGAEQPLNPSVEALSAFWRYYFPDEYIEVEKAHASGSLFYSMECVPQTVKCAAVCGMSYAYDGRQSPTYCDHLNQPAAKKRLGHPHFMGGALIIPPAKPGWKNADITQLSSLMDAHVAEADAAYRAIKEELPHLGERQWEAMVGQLMKMAYADMATPLPTIRTSTDLVDAIKNIGKAKPEDQGKIKAHIVGIAKALGCQDLLPGGWSS